MLRIKNKEKLDKWIFKTVVVKQHDVVAIKGMYPYGIKTAYSAEHIFQPINVAWRDIVTGQVYPIIYEVCNEYS